MTFRFVLASARRVALCKIFVRNEIFLGAIRVDGTRADSFRLSVSKNGVTQMFIIAAARRGKNVGGILLLLDPAARGPFALI